MHRAMTEIDLAAVAETVQAHLPGLRPEGPLARSLKCCLIAASLDGRPVVIKWLVRTDPPWAWYFERERRLLAVLAAPDDSTIAPALLASGPRWMVLSRCTGTALAAGRFARDADVSTVAAALAARRRLGCTTTPWPDVPQDDRTRAEIRARLLEDPCDGLHWCCNGLARGADLGLIDRTDAALAIDALRRWPVLARSHGDLLPRNVIVDGATARLVDLECAGDHPEAWDHALLWANVPAAARLRVEEDFGRDPPPRRRAFWACVVFALVRELKFARGARFAAGLRDTLRVAVTNLRGLMPTNAG
jgi:hypothetical protein